MLPTTSAPDTDDAESRTDPGGPSRRTTSQVLAPLAVAALRALSVLMMSLAVAVVVVAGLELTHTRTDPRMADAGWLAGFRVWHALGVGVLWAVVLVLYGLTGRMWAAAGTALVVGAVGAFADYQKMQLRGEPLYPTDTDYLRDPSLLFESMGIDPTAALVAVVAAVLVVLAAVAVSVVRARRRPANRRRWVGRGLALAVGIVGLVVAAGFNQDGNRLRAAYEANGVAWARWDQVENYARNGFVAGFLYNLPGTAMDRPEGYSAQAMDELVAEYRGLAEEINASRDPAALTDTNVLIVLGETVADPTRLEGLEFPEDPMPFLRALMERTTSGSMLSSGYGGGTANVEFEALTGMALTNFRSQMHTPYQMLVPHHDDFPSFLRTLGADRATLAIHPFKPSFYRRDAVYPALGFDRSIFADDMANPEWIENDPNISDASTYRAVLDELRASDEPMFVNVVTMQNHRAYEGKYSDPMAVEGPLAGTLGEDAGQWLRGLRHSDLAVEQLVADLEALDERTVVLFYGDHLASVWSDEVRAAVPLPELYRTPWFVWANFPTTPVDPGAEVLAPYHLVNQLLATAGAPVTPYDALLAAVAEEVPAMEPTMTLDHAGEQIEAADLSPRAQQLLADYRMVQFDLTAGRGFGTTELLSVPAG